MPADAETRRQFGQSAHVVTLFTKFDPENKRHAGGDGRSGENERDGEKVREKVWEGEEGERME